jgi:hypothetical protein
MVGLPIIGAATGIGVLALLLQKTMWMLANPSPEYADITRRFVGHNPNGDLDGIYFFYALFTGPDTAVGSVIATILGQILAVLQPFILIGGYVVCLAVPPKFGTWGQAFSLIALGAFNLILRVVFWLLPLFGIGYLNLPLLVPELSLLSAGTDRAQPIMMTWMDYPFWESLLAYILILIQLAEPMMLGVFVRSLGLSMKDDAVSSAGLRLVMLTLGQAFMQMVIYMTFMAGTSNVLQWFLFVMYWLSWSFWIGTVVYIALVMFWVPKRIQKELGETDEEEEESE